MTTWRPCSHLWRRCRPGDGCRGWPTLSETPNRCKLLQCEGAPPLLVDRPARAAPAPQVPLLRGSESFPHLRAGTCPTGPAAPNRCVYLLASGGPTGPTAPRLREAACISRSRERPATRVRVGPSRPRQSRNQASHPGSLPTKNAPSSITSSSNLHPPAPPLHPASFPGAHNGIHLVTPVLPRRLLGLTLFL